MSWLRVGDTFATDPRVLELGSAKDDRLLNEAAGFVVRCAAQSAGHKQDAFVSDATAALVGGSRTPVLIRLARRAGVFVDRTTRDGKPGYQLIADPDLLHIRLQAEVDWEAEHRRLLRDPDVFLPVRLRDGDGCRYCARIVMWKDGKSGRGGTLDHVVPDGEDLVVACRACNSRKQNRTLADAGMTLLPVPPEPLYSQHTRSVFERYGITDPRPGSQPDPALRPGTQPDTATAPSCDPAPSRTPPSDPAASRTPPTRTTKHGPSPDEADPAPPDQAPSGRVGTGRVGSGAPAPPPPAAPTRRTRQRGPSSRGLRGQPSRPPA